MGVEVSTSDYIDNSMFYSPVEEVVVDRDFRTASYLFVCKKCGDIFIRRPQFEIQEMKSIGGLRALIKLDYAEHKQACKQQKETSSPLSKRLIRFKRKG
jgi:hypothetical protein